MATHDSPTGSPAGPAPADLLSANRTKAGQSRRSPIAGVRSSGRSRAASPPLALVLLLILTAPGATPASGRSSQAPGSSTPTQVEAPRIEALRVTGPIRIDGKLDEACWRSPSAAPLVQNEPDNGCPPRQRTEWWIAYDEAAFYLACRMYDAAPESIVCGLGRRDSWPSSDSITLDIDTFNDDRSGYEFSLTPAGAFADAAVYNDGAEDYSWDGIWSYQVRVDSLGWAAEMRIPFSQIKLPRRDEQRWGVNLCRHVERYQERDDLMHMPREASGYVSLFPDLVGIRGVQSGHRPELLSYAVGKGDFQHVDKRDPFRSSTDLRGDLGADVNWPLTNDLALTATVNPDFGQVEVDPAVINLSDSETYYEERRPFFVEDANGFRFGNEGTNSNWNFNWMDPYLFYSRRVGQAPRVSLPAHDYADVPGATTILGAVKAAGTIGRSSLAFVNAWTSEERARIDLAGTRSSSVVEPRTTYTATRWLRSGSEGGRGLGLMATNTWRRLDDERSRAEVARDATVLGIDGWTRLDPAGVWALRGYLDGSYIHGSARAIDDLQRSSNHYYQRPDASHLRYDPTRTSLQGIMGRAVLNKQSGRSSLNMSAGAASPGFDLNDAGYSSRADVINWSLAAGYRWPEPNRTFRSRGFNLASYYSWDSGWNPDAYGYGLFWNATFTNYWDASGQFFYNPARYSLRAARGGPAMRLSDNREFSFNVGSDDRKALSARLYVNGSRQGDGSGSGGISMDATLRPRSSLSITCSPSGSWSRDLLGWVGVVDDPLMTATYGSRYLFGTLTYREASLSTRVDCTFTPRLTLQAYVQPLIGVGTYSDIMELARPRSYAFNRYGLDNGSTIVRDAADREYRIDPDGPGPLGAFTIDDPDFNYKSLKVNLVLRWEYLPGSTLYLVWTQTRTDARDPGDFRLGRDVRSLLDTISGNSIQAKVTKWWEI